MASNAFTVVTNDARAAKVTGMQRHEMQEAQPGTGKETKVIFDERGLIAVIGRGETNPLITYKALNNAAGVLCYIYPNAAGNGVLCSTVKP
jgi:hypothetical protein